MNLKHLIISGGGPSLFLSLGVISSLFKEKIIHFHQLESIYGTSAGAAMALMLALNFDIDTIYDYLIKRPWQDLFKITPENLMSLFNNKGLFKNDLIKKIFKPLFEAKSVPLDITMEDFYQLSKIDLHFFGFDLSKFDIVDLSHESYPNLPILDGIQMSCAVPLMIAPFFYENMCVIDGGIHTNYPLQPFLKKYNNMEDVIGIKNVYNDLESVVESSTLLDFVLNIINKLVRVYNHDKKSPEIKHEISFNISQMSMNSITEAVYKQSVREELYNKGISTALSFIEKWKKDNNEIQ